MAACRITENTLWRALRELETAGLVSREKAHRNSNRYRVYVPAAVTAKEPVIEGAQSPQKERQQPPQSDGGHPPQKERRDYPQTEGRKGIPMKEPQRRESNEGIATADGVASQAQFDEVAFSEGEPRAPRPANPLFDALARAEGSAPEQLTRSAARAVGVALAEIRKVCEGLTPEEIGRRARNYRAQMPDVTLTAHALAKHWARCDRAPAGRGGTSSYEEEARKHGYTI
jgi:hypothetical protein